MGLHRIHIDEPVTEGPCRVEGDEAMHAARVKRIVAGAWVEILDGQGGAGSGVVSGVGKDRGEWWMDVKIEKVEKVERARPRMEVCTAIPKGARLGEMIDGLAQVGAAVWRPLETVHGEREDWRRERVESIAREASKQSGRAWLMEIGEGLNLGEAEKRDGWEVVMADASGERYEGRGEQVRLLIGPEGGWTEGEIESARTSGVRVCRFGVHTMRIETAAVVAAGMVMGPRG